MDAVVDIAPSRPTPRNVGPAIRVALAIFDVPLLSLGFRAAIDAEPDLGVVTEVEDRDALVAELAAAEADVAIVEDGAEAASRLTSEAIEAARAMLPGIRLLALEGPAAAQAYAVVLRAGVDGVLTRDADPSDVVAAIRSVHRGETYVSPSLVTRMVNTYVLRRGSSPTTEDAYDALSDREREILLLAATGHTNREMAGMFDLSEQTIHNCRAGVMEKLGVHDRVELLKYAMRRGVITVADL